MRISEHKYDYVGLEFSYDEVKEVLALNPERVDELVTLLEKYVTWISDVKKIRTKEIFQRASK